jgi:hypothetical protein
MQERKMNDSKLIPFPRDKDNVSSKDGRMIGTEFEGYSF